MSLNINLEDAQLFIRVVELGTLSAAARERDVPVSQVTRALARLEARCGVRLLHRSTHGLSLTDEGDLFQSAARRMLETAEVLHSELTGKLAGPSGWVRVSVSSVIAQALITPSLPSLYQHHPQLHLDILADDRIVDMAREGVDIAIRTGSPAGDTLVAREIGKLSRALYASPAYLRTHGEPRGVEDLAGHHLIGNSASLVLNQWRLGRGREATTLHVSGHTRTDNTAVALSLVREGVGIGRVVNIVAGPLVARGELVPVLADLTAETPVPVYAVMLHERQRLPKMRACIDHWAAWLTSAAFNPTVSA
ncbi:MAG: LysR family transcriptional regulator [Burkholderiaceae bacterium]|nr:LysR family transcriptional regulator [Aquabacterium sp.]NUP85437.1 LysR family transcriptional regulator [Burkholderiaceae bacterium]